MNYCGGQCGYGAVSQQLAFPICTLNPEVRGEPEFARMHRELSGLILS